VPEADALLKVILAAGSPLVSPGIVTLDEPNYAFARGFLVRDPDGHVMQIMEKRHGK